MRSMEQLIDQQVKRWTHGRRERGPAVEVAPPSVTISREFGSRGAGVGQLVAGTLGLTYFDQGIVARLADAAGASTGPLAWLDERPRGPWSDFVDGILLGDRYTESEYLRHLIQVVREIDRQGGAVVVGRGAHCILGPQRALRVRIVAPREARIAGVADRRGLSEEEAADLVDRTDAERAEFLRHHYDRSLDDPATFDLVVNTGTMTVTQAADLVASAWCARFPHR